MAAAGIDSWGAIWPRVNDGASVAVARLEFFATPFAVVPVMAALVRWANLRLWTSAWLLVWYELCPVGLRLLLQSDVSFLGGITVRTSWLLWRALSYHIWR